MRSAYWSGEVTIATFAWFLAEPRTIAGPPMSICSTTASGSAPDATVSVNGYRLDTTSSNASMPSSESWIS